MKTQWLWLGLAALALAWYWRRVRMAEIAGAANHAAVANAQGMVGIVKTVLEYVF